MAIAFQLIFSAAGQSLLDYIIFFIHESGHIIFSMSGQFMYVFGGTIVQIAIPFSFFVYFLLMRKFFASGFTLLWLGNSITSMALYMKDARQLVLELEGRYHDWNWLFKKLNLLNYDQYIGNFFYAMGLICIFGGLIVMYTMIILQIHQRRRC